jgi:transcriptional regulator with XRE-family HTH domain
MIKNKFGRFQSWMRYMSPEEWRKDRGLSQEAMARVVGVSGKNPSRTWQRWESGEAQPPIRIIAKIDSLTDGKVNLQSWAVVRAARETGPPLQAAVA